MAVVASSSLAGRTFAAGRGFVEVVERVTWGRPGAWTLRDRGRPATPRRGALGFSWRVSPGRGFRCGGGFGVRVRR